MAEFLFKFPHGDLGDMFRVKYTQSPESIPDHGFKADPKKL